MIKVTVGVNVDYHAVIVDENITLRKVFEDNGVVYSFGMPTLNGASLRTSDLDKTFAEFGITDSCFLIVAKKLKAETCGSQEPEVTQVDIEDLFS